MDGTKNTRYTILLVEDEPIVGKVCARILAAGGYAVTLVTNGLIAKDALRKNSFDICLSDIRTPEMNGIELFKYLTENHAELAKKTLFMTGDVLSREVKTFLEESGARYITKPFTDAQLNAAIKELTK